ncbi:MAG: SDR family NAD(P)-dependent oxidoreductase, partial [Actinomycetota bacterium]|nr:SDR family NAD(P)-dependent oxidoreductase [Actinomycetota bacterium]
MANRLQDKVCIVTGSGRGIGRAVALAFAAEGAPVVVNDVDADAAKDTAETISSAGGAAEI